MSIAIDDLVGIIIVSFLAGGMVMLIVVTTGLHIHDKRKDDDELDRLTPRDN